jgi:hypothetical protein
MMSVRLALMTVLLVLGGCAGGQTGGVAALDWQAGLQGDLLTVTLVDESGAYRVERVALAGPDGVIAEASEMTRETLSARGSGNPGVGLGGSYGSSSGGSVGLVLRLPVGTPAPPPAARRTVARIRLPDAPAYRRYFSRAWIQIRLRDSAGKRRQATLPAPPPEP